MESVAKTNYNICRSGKESDPLENPSSVGDTIRVCHKRPSSGSCAKEGRSVDECAKEEAINEDEAFTGEFPVGHSVDRGRVT